MISNSYFSNWYIVYTVRSRTEEKKWKRRYLRRIPTCTYSWQKRKRSHIKFLLLLLNLTPIIKQKEELRQRIWRYIKTPKHQMKTWILLNALTHSNSVSDGNQRRRQFRLRFLFKRRTIVRSTVWRASSWFSGTTSVHSSEGENSSVTVSMCVASRSRIFVRTELSERTVVLV